MLAELLSTKKDEEWMQHLQSNHGLTWYITGEEQWETMDLRLMQIDSSPNAGYPNVRGEWAPEASERGRGISVPVPNSKAVCLTSSQDQSCWNPTLLPTIGGG